MTKNEIFKNAVDTLNKVINTLDDDTFDEFTPEIRKLDEIHIALKKAKFNNQEEV